MLKLEEKLKKRNIPFDHIERRIRYVQSLSYLLLLIVIFRCFPHIVNLACKAVLSAITNLDYANDVEGEEEQPSSFDAVDGDPIATLRSLIRAVG